MSLMIILVRDPASSRLHHGTDWRTWAENNRERSEGRASWSTNCEGGAPAAASRPSRRSVRLRVLSPMCRICEGPLAVVLVVAVKEGAAPGPGAVTEAGVSGSWTAATLPRAPRAASGIGTLLRSVLARMRPSSALVVVW